MDSGAKDNEKVLRFERDVKGEVKKNESLTKKKGYIEEECPFRDEREKAACKIRTQFYSQHEIRFPGQGLSLFGDGLADWGRSQVPYLLFPEVQGRADK